MPNQLKDNYHYLCGLVNKEGKIYDWECHQADKGQLWWCDNFGNGGAYSIEHFDYVYEIPKEED